MHNTSQEQKIKEDFENTLEKCIQIKQEIWKNRNIDIRIVEALLRLISPLL